jgi:hypothetical protein
MGHEIIVFGDKHERFEITPLALTFAFLSRCGAQWIDTEHPGDPRRAWFETWSTQLKTTTVFFDPELDRLIVTTEDRDTLLGAIDYALARLRSEGPELSTSTLESLLPGGALFDKPLSISTIESTLSRLRSLLRSKPLASTKQR